MKKKIVIASVLKPVDDPRAFWKISQSIAKTNKYEVNIIGNSSKKEISYPDIYLHPHKVSRNNLIGRLFVRLDILFKLLAIKPSLLIITTHELIQAAFILKIFTRCKVVYDVQENYAANINHLSTSTIKKLFAVFVRLKEHLSKIFVDQYWLAEKCYSDELSFVQKNFMVLENKAIAQPETTRNPNTINLIFSGTISKYGGVQNALNVYKAIKKIKPDSSLHIIGQIHDSALKKWLIDQQEQSPDIKLEIDENPIPYSTIVEAISKSNLGIIGYEENPVNRDKVPTKLYEYSRYKLPYVVSKNTLWSQKGIELGGAIPIDFNQIDTTELLDLFANPENIISKPYPSSETWEYEATKLLPLLYNLI